MREVLSGSAVALVFKLIGAALAMVFQVMLARMLGAEAAGQYVLGITCMTLAIMLGSMGLDSIVVRYVATNSVVAHWVSIASVRRNAMRIAIPASLLFTGLLFLLADWIAISLFKDKQIAVLIRILSLAVPFWVVASLHSEILRGLKKIAQYQMIQSVLMPFVTLTGLIIFGLEYGIVGQAISYVAAAFITMILAVFWWFQAAPSDRRGGTEIPVKTLLNSSTPLMWAASMFYLNGWVATIFLGMYGSATDVALFNAANKLAWAISFVLLSVNSISAPKFAAIYKNGTILELQRTAIQTTRLMTLIALPLMGACLLMPKFFLLLFGAEFGSAALVLQLLVLGQLINVMTGSVGQILMMTGHEKDLRNVISSGAMLNTLLAFVLVQYFGLIGVAWSVAISTAYTSLAASFMVHRRLRIQTHIFSQLSKGAR